MNAAAARTNFADRRDVFNVFLRGVTQNVNGIERARVARRVDHTADCFSDAIEQLLDP